MDDYLFEPELSAEEARWLLSQTHYLGDVPAATTHRFGAFFRDKLDCVATYGPCHAPRLPKSYIELSRLTSRGLGTPLSKFLAEGLRVLKREGVPAVLTWADPAAGHHGGIYQATNWVYAEPRSYNWNFSFRDEEGGVINHRKAFSLFGTSSKKKVLALKPNWEAFLPPMKLRYVMPLNISEEQCLAELRAVKKPYPKPRDGSVKRPSFQQRSLA